MQKNDGHNNPDVVCHVNCCHYGNHIHHINGNIVFNHHSDNFALEHWNVNGYKHSELNHDHNAIELRLVYRHDDSYHISHKNVAHQNVANHHRHYNPNNLCNINRDVCASRTYRVPYRRELQKNLPRFGRLILQGPGRHI